MPKFRVEWNEIIHCEATIEADTAAQAIEQSYWINQDELDRRQFFCRSDDSAQKLEE
jgi:hypothetical protein